MPFLARNGDNNMNKQPTQDQHSEIRALLGLDNKRRNPRFWITNG